jgi:DNA repair photolyase
MHGGRRAGRAGGIDPTVSVAVREWPVRSALTPQRAGFLTQGPYPFTHSLSPYVGCAFGLTACGRYCYAQWLPAWRTRGGSNAWGSVVWVKQGLAGVLAAELERLSDGTRRALRLFVSPATDSYQPLERRFGIMREVLTVLGRYPHINLVVVQTRSPLVARDFDLLAAMPAAVLSVTLETDDEEAVRRWGGGPGVAARARLVEEAVAAGIPTQVVVAPCLPHSPTFADRILELRPDRVVVDTVVDGDGAGGRRTARLPYGQTPGWNAREPALALFQELRRQGLEVGWSGLGFSGIEPGWPQRRREAKKEPISRRTTCQA